MRRKLQHLIGYFVAAVLAGWVAGYIIYYVYTK